MRKIVILVIIVLGLIGGVGGYFISSNSANKITNSSKQAIVDPAASNNIKSLISPNNEPSPKSSTFSDTSSESNAQVQSNANNESNTKKFTIRNTNSENDAQTQSQGNTTISNNVMNKNNIVAPRNNTNNSTKSVSNMNFSIKWVLGKNQYSIPNTVVIRNNTGEKIPNKQLVRYIKNWILNAQINYSQGCAATMWVPEFFNVVPDNDLVQAFINSNGRAALSRNITAGELGKTNEEVAKLIGENQPLLTQSQIFEYIYQYILPKNQISKIENQRYSYLIYSKAYGNHILYNSISKYTGMTAC